MSNRERAAGQIRVWRDGRARLGWKMRVKGEIVWNVRQDRLHEEKDFADIASLCSVSWFSIASFRNLKSHHDFS